MAVLLKWWRSRMLGGYKHISGILTDSEGDRCDPTLRRRQCRTSCHCSAPTEHTLLYDSDEVDAARRNDHTLYSDEEPDCLTDDEESCSEADTVPVVERSDPEARHSPSHKPKSEFNFTLYDFDGHGQVTRDDIAGLVKAIYEVVGSSVRVPASGSKTIHVKLSVSPEQSHVNTTSTSTHHGDINITVNHGVNTARRRDPCVRSGRVGAGQPAGRRPQRPPPRRPTTAAAQKQHLTEMLTSNMQRNYVNFSNIRSSGLERPRARQPSPCPYRPEEPPAVRRSQHQQLLQEGHHCTEQLCPHQTSSQLSGEQRRQDYELLTRCAEFALQQQTHVPVPRQLHRHRHRHRAMQQVLSWLEREHHSQLLKGAPGADRQLDGLKLSRWQYPTDTDPTLNLEQHHVPVSPARNPERHRASVHPGPIPEGHSTSVDPEPIPEEHRGSVDPEPIPEEHCGSADPVPDIEGAKKPGLHRTPARRVEHHHVHKHVHHHYHHLNASGALTEAVIL